MYGFIKNNRITQVAKSYQAISGNIVVRLDSGRVNIGKEEDVLIIESNSFPSDWMYRDADLNIVDDAYIVAQTEKAIDGLIQSEIDSYNKENSVAFKDINALPKYTLTPAYTHFDFCVSMIEWNTLVWDKSRQIQIDVASGIIPRPNSTEEFMSLLPVRV